MSCLMCMYYYDVCSLMAKVHATYCGNEFPLGAIKSIHYKSKIIDERCIRESRFKMPDVGPQCPAWVDVTRRPGADVVPEPVQNKLPPLVLQPDSLDSLCESRSVTSRGYRSVHKKWCKSCSGKTSCGGLLFFPFLSHPPKFASFACFWTGGWESININTCYSVPMLFVH